MESYRRTKVWPLVISISFENTHLTNTLSIFALTGISEVEVIFNVARNVVFPSELWPVCVRLLIIPDENSKQDDHSNLPDEADCRQTNTHIGVLWPAEKILYTLTAVPHVDASVVVLVLAVKMMMLLSLLSWALPAVTCSSISASIYRDFREACALLLHSHSRGGNTLPVSNETTPYIWACYCNQSNLPKNKAKFLLMQKIILAA